jgi:hypothetical protein
MVADIEMLASMLLCLFEGFQGNYDLAADHFKSAITQLLHRDLKRTHTKSHRMLANANYESLQTFTRRLEKRAPEIFGSPTFVLSCPSGTDQLDPIPNAFTSLEHARDVIIAEGQYIWEAWRQLRLGQPQGFQTQHLHVSRLLEWSKAYAEFSKSDRRQHRPLNKPHLLKAYRETLYLIILAQLAFHEPDGGAVVPICRPNPETCTSHETCQRHAHRKNTLDAHFARIIVSTKSLFQDHRTFLYDKYSISFDSGIGPSLNLSASPCDSTKVRYQATSILPKGALQTKVWNTLGMYSIAEKLGSIEEHAVVAAVTIPEVQGAKWIDLSCFMEEQVMILRYCREDEFGGLIWSEEWMTY